MILITGAGGYIGRQLTSALLARGEQVRALDVRSEALAPLRDRGAEAIVADAGDPLALGAALHEATVVYHLAGSALGSPQQIVRANVEGAKALAAACVSRSALRAVVFAGSGALYPSGTSWLDETTAPRPTFHYARAKHGAEQALLAAHHDHGVPVQIARIAAVYGPGSPALMLEQLRRGRFPLIGGGRGYASNVHVDDLIDALLAMAERGRPGQIYNLADDEPAPIREFYAYLAGLLGAPPPPVVPTLAGQALVAMVNTTARLRGRPAPLPVDLVAMAQVSHRMTNRRMREELGVTLRYRSYRDGLPTVVLST